jgi:hypothetical protein
VESALALDSFNSNCVTNVVCAVKTQGCSGPIDWHYGGCQDKRGPLHSVRRILDKLPCVHKLRMHNFFVDQKLGWLLLGILTPVRSTLRELTLEEVIFQERWEFDVVQDFIKVLASHLDSLEHLVLRGSGFRALPDVVLSQVRTVEVTCN